MLHTTVYDPLVSSCLLLQLSYLCHVESRTIFLTMVPFLLTTVSVEGASSCVLVVLLLRLPLHPSNVWLEIPVVVIPAQLYFVDLLPRLEHYCWVLLHLLLVPTCSDRIGSESYL